MVPRNEVVPQFSGPRESTFRTFLAAQIGGAPHTVARAVAASLLELPGARSADGACPASHEVERDFKACWPGSVVDGLRAILTCCDGFFQCQEKRGSRFRVQSRVLGF